MAKKDESVEVKVASPHDISAGRYANMIQVTMQAEEFVLDFLAAHGETASHLARIFVTPTHAKRLRDLLKRQVTKYEREFGIIKAKTKRGRARTTSSKARKRRTKRKA